MGVLLDAIRKVRTGSACFPESECQRSICRHDAGPTTPKLKSVVSYPEPIKSVRAFEGFPWIADSRAPKDDWEHRFVVGHRPVPLRPLLPPRPPQPPLPPSLPPPLVSRVVA